MKPLVIANWKMNPGTRRAAASLLAALGRGLRGLRGVEVAVAPPFPYLAAAAARRRPFKLASQDVSGEAAGASTGEVSARMLADLGVAYVIVGHSERRRLLGEDDQAVNRKVKSALAAGLAPVIAVGEEAREAAEVVPPVLERQLSLALAGVPRRALGRVVVAYEPVWAIGAGRSDTPDNATRRAIYLRKILVKLAGRGAAEAVRILYGGSVTAKNAAGFIGGDVRGMEGLLVGGASLKAEEFIQIVRSVAGGLGSGVSAKRKAQSSKR